MIKKIFALIAALVLLVSVVPTVFAQQSPSLNAKGSIRIYMEWEDEKLDDGALSLYRVCDIVKRDGDYRFEPIAQLQKYDLDLNNMSESEQAEQFARLAKAEKLRRFTSPIQNGEAYFANLTTGLYVVVQYADEASDGFEPINTFLISVPQFENGGYQLHVQAYPKVELEPEETTPTETGPTETTPPGTKPTEPGKPPQLPQTGQLNWPVPLLAVSGLMLIVAGCLILLSGRKDRDEKNNW